MSLDVPAGRVHDIARLREALHPLDAPPTGPGWNSANVLDLLHPETPMAEAAVLVGLVPRGRALHVVLTRRSESLRNHGGQVAFPGGRVDPGDRDAVAAALRETHEEIGLPPSQVTPVGLLDPMVTITGFRVLPVVASLDPAHVVRPNAAEVAEVFEVPLDFLLDPVNLVHRRIAHGGRDRDMVEFRYPPQRIWGATAAILYNFRRRLEGKA